MTYEFNDQSKIDLDSRTCYGGPLDGAVLPVDFVINAAKRGSVWGLPMKVIDGFWVLVPKADAREMAVYNPRLVGIGLIHVFHEIRSMP